MRSKHANNSRAITQGDYDNMIKKLKLLDKKVKGKNIPGFTSNDYNLANTHEILTVEKNGTIIERLVRPSKEDPNKKLRYITIENMFEQSYKDESKTNYGLTPLHEACQLDHFEMILNKVTGFAFGQIFGGKPLGANLWGKTFGGKPLEENLWGQRKVILDL